MTRLTNPAAFFNALRSGKLLGPTLSVPEVEGLQVITDAAGVAGWPVAYVAYALATAYHETAGTMQPIKEYGSDEYLRRRYDVTGLDPARARAMGNKKPGDGVKFCGRGYPQVTWFVNYKRAQDETGYGFVDNPDLMLSPKPAAEVMIKGMAEGWFTGRKLSTYLPSTRLATVDEFKASRKIINGTDRNLDIAEYAMLFQSALTAGGWA